MDRPTQARQCFDQVKRELQEQSHPYLRQLWQLAIRRSRLHRRRDLICRTLDAERRRRDNRKSLRTLGEYEIALADGGEASKEEAVQILKEDSVLHNSLAFMDEPPEQVSDLPSQLLPGIAEGLFRSEMQSRIWACALAYRHEGRDMPAFEPRGKRLADLNEVLDNGVTDFKKDFMKGGDSQIALMDFKERFRESEDFREDVRRRYQGAREQSIETRPVARVEQTEQITQKLSAVLKSLLWIWSYQETPHEHKAEGEIFLSLLRNEGYVLSGETDEMQNFEVTLLQRRYRLETSLGVLTVADYRAEGFQRLLDWEDAFVLLSEDEGKEASAQKHSSTDAKYLEAAYALRNRADEDFKGDRPMAYFRAVSKLVVKPNGDTVSERAVYDWAARRGYYKKHHINSLSDIRDLIEQAAREFAEANPEAVRGNKQQ